MISWTGDTIVFLRSLLLPDPAFHRILAGALIVYCMYIAQPIYLQLAYFHI